MNGVEEKIHAAIVQWDPEGSSGSQQEIGKEEANTN